MGHLNIKVNEDNGLLTFQIDAYDWEYFEAGGTPILPGRSWTQDTAGPVAFKGMSKFYSGILNGPPLAMRVDINGVPSTAVVAMVGETAQQDGTSMYTFTGLAYVVGAVTQNAASGEQGFNAGKLTGSLSIG